MPLIVVLVIISIISVITIGIHLTNNKNQQIANNGNNQEEKMQAAIVTETLQSGKTLTVGTTGIYKIELHGGHGENKDNVQGGKGSKVTGYVSLKRDDKVECSIYDNGGNGIESSDYTSTTKGGNGMALKLNGTLIAVAGGGGGVPYVFIVQDGCEHFYKNMPGSEVTEHGVSNTINPTYVADGKDGGYRFYKCWACDRNVTIYDGGAGGGYTSGTNGSAGTSYVNTEVVFKEPSLTGEGTNVEYRRQQQQ